MTVENRIKLGESIGEALETVPELSSRTLSLVRAGETVGRLPQTLRRLVEQQRIAFARESAEAAFTWGYPTAVASMIVLAIILFIVRILPKFVKIFEDFGNPMPQTTVLFLQFAKWMEGALTRSGPFLAWRGLCCESSRWPRSRYCAAHPWAGRYSIRCCGICPSCTAWSATAGWATSATSSNRPPAPALRSRPRWRRRGSCG